LSTTDESPAAAVAAPAVADPAPLGLAGFALTTFLLSAFNAGWTRGGGAEWLPYALVYGGLAQLLAGMWEFRNKNVFGATAFATYGSFWIGLFFYFHFIAVGTGENVGNDLGWILLAFAIPTTYLLIFSAQANAVLFGVFLFLDLALIFLFIGNFAGQAPGHSLVRVGGIIGMVTALLAWYASAAGIANGMGGKIKLPVGSPLVH
jgi:uncharacterized protein